MMVEWSENCRQNLSRTLPRKCTAIAEPRKAQTTRNCDATRRMTMARTPQKASGAVFISRIAWPHSRRPHAYLRRELVSGGLQSVDQAGVDQEPVEAAGFGAVLAAVEHPLAAQHDVLLLLERRIERHTGRLLDHQRQIGPVDRVHHGRTFDRREVNG